MSGRAGTKRIVTARPTHFMLGAKGRAPSICAEGHPITHKPSTNAWVDRDPFYNTFMVTDPAEYRAIANHIVNEWDVEMLIPAHGDILRGKEFIRDVLTKHFQL